MERHAIEETLFTTLNHSVYDGSHPASVIGNTTTFLITSDYNKTSTPATSTSSIRLYTTFSVCGNLTTLISLVGIVGNSLNIVVLSKMLRRDRNSKTKINHLLLAMGVADLLTLLCSFIYSISMFTQWPPLLWQELSDKHTNFIHIVMMMWYLPANVFSLASNWCIVAFTIYRFLAVTYPLHISFWCTVSRVRLTIFIIFFLALLLNIPDWLTLFVVKHADGRIRVKETQLYNKLALYYTIYQILEVWIPIGINIVLVSAIIYNLYTTRNYIKQFLRDDILAARERNDRRIGYTLISIVSLFIICTIPQVVYIILREYTGGKSRVSNEKANTLQTYSIVAGLFLLINHAANVFLYCLVYKSYRDKFMEIVKCCKSKNMPTQQSQLYRKRVGVGSVSSKTTKSTQVDVELIELIELKAVCKDPLLRNASNELPDKVASKQGEDEGLL